jgi:hypothetical protein
MKSKADFNGLEGFHSFGPDPMMGRTQGKSPTSGLTPQPELAPDSLVGADAPPYLGAPIQVDEATFKALGNADQNSSYAIKAPSVAPASPDAPAPIHEQLPQKIAKLPTKLAAPVSEDRPTGS